MSNWTQKLKIQHLRLLICIGEQGNLSKVAEIMGITQPALSKWLGGLEEDIGITLFERHSKGLRPSEGGRLLLEHAQRILNDLERSQEDIEQFKMGIKGSLIIGSSPVATDCVSLALLSLVNDYPSIHVKVVENVMTSLLQSLISGKIDVVVGRVGGKALQLPLNYQTLYTEPVCFVGRCNHPLANRESINWQDLLEYNWIVWPTGTPIRTSIDNAIVDQGVMLPNNYLESSSMNVTINMIQASDIVSILSWRLAHRYVEKGQLAILPLPRIEQKGSVGVFWRKDTTPSDALQCFLSHLTKTSAESENDGVFVISN
ncbi:LysR family transcriptional regulator [Xenorhabdus bovienii]|uniref:Putative transcriptional regulator n=2 Tax=Xenorhabdus bovienii TaxID=40576 RepID=A0A077NL95_XENBV|nr:LysR family transcriptional regulator [Xenorhabdus bovienii]CDG90028.1 putative transcriptional regulator [Xenorhabdus bovienii str. feltiae France]CDG93292.1 putative transcriptional regulator [Xenorhabdus bovienii str. feltiae Florida]CDG98665.1 putative transcriptional regulator [Xenorhabdus bovienii str. puntauvense]CDH01864.1 putative transcriptional regulator [Xenorhabdus bovienii str. feltiae Moldova]